MKNKVKKLIVITSLLVSSVSLAQPDGVGNCELTDGNFAPGVEGGVTGWIGHPCPQPRPGNGGFFGSMQTLSEDGSTTFVVTPEGQHAPVNNSSTPPGSNFLMTVNSNLYDFNGDEMPNTQPSELNGSGDYMLHDGPVLTRSVNKTSPTDDLDAIIDTLEADAPNSHLDRNLINRAIRILEGRPVSDRAYSGFPMLHYNGPNKIAVVEPICASMPCAEDAEVIGGNVDVDMIYWDQHIESTAAFIDPSAVQDVPWTITYKISVLTGGIEDFSPMTMHFDRTPDNKIGPMHASMDQSYFPMLDEGVEYTIKIKQSKGKYYNLTYTWGWRIHPPRVQVSENALKMGMSGEPGVGPKTLPQWERDAFGDNPNQNFFTRFRAIRQIGDIAPAKRMWNNLRYLRLISFVYGFILNKSENKALSSPEKLIANLEAGFAKRDTKYLDQYEKSLGLNDIMVKAQSNRKLLAQYESALDNAKSSTKTSFIVPLITRVIEDLRKGYLDWDDRTRLPEGVTADPDATITLLYANNTIYGSKQGTTGDGSGMGAGRFKGVCNGCAHDWEIRPYTYNVTLYNGDHFVHGYMNVDFGGTRGWENQFQDTDPNTALGEHIHDENTVIIGDRTDIDPSTGLPIVTVGNVVDTHNILLDTTTNDGKIALAIDPLTGDHIFSDDKIFPMNTGGLEEFLKESPRNLDDPVNGDPLLGSGCYFTFGRNYAWPNAGGPWGAIFVPPVSNQGVLGKHKVQIEYNFEPSRRLKIYQFDPIHHDVAIYSLH